MYSNNSKCLSMKLNRMISEDNYKKHIEEYWSESQSLERYYSPNHTDIAANYSLNHLYYQLLELEEYDDIREEDEDYYNWGDNLLNQYFIERFKYTDKLGNDRCRLVFHKIGTPLYHINNIYRKMVDHCHNSGLFMNGRPLIGPHNYVAFQSWFSSK